jgi:hypothetical protein
LHFANPFPPIVTTSQFSSIKQDSSSLHPSNDPSPIIVTDVGISILITETQCSRDDSLEFRIDLEIDSVEMSHIFEA